MKKQLIDRGIFIKLFNISYIFYDLTSPIEIGHNVVKTVYKHKDIELSIVVILKPVDNVLIEKFSLITLRIKGKETELKDYHTTLCDIKNVVSDYLKETTITLTNNINKNKILVFAIDNILANISERKTYD